MYEMMTGLPPFRGDDYLEVFRRKAAEDPAPPSTLRADVSPAVDAMVMKALSRTPMLRHDSMAALAEDIVQILNGGM
jgi:serine/threonine-protein kinase